MGHLILGGIGLFIALFVLVFCERWRIQRKIRRGESLRREEAQFREKLQAS